MCVLFAAVHGVQLLGWPHPALWLAKVTRADAVMWGTYAVGGTFALAYVASLIGVIAPRAVGMTSRLAAFGNALAMLFGGLIVTVAAHFALRWAIIW